MRRKKEERREAKEREREKEKRKYLLMREEREVNNIYIYLASCYSAQP